VSQTRSSSDTLALANQPSFNPVNNATSMGQNPTTSVGGNDAKPQFQSNIGIPGVVGYVDNSALQFLAMGPAGRSGVNPFFMQQASSVQACSMQQTSVLETPTSSTFQQPTESTNETENSSEIPPSSVSQSIPSTTSSQQSLVQDNQSPAGPSTLQIRKTLNNVNIVNNIGTNLQAFQQPVSNSQTVTNPTSSQAGIMSAIAGQGVHGSVMIPSVNMVNPMGVMGGGIMPINMMGGMPGMTSTPLLLPQVNGPTLLVNVPNYMAYQGIPNIAGMPNMVMQGIFGPQIATISSVASMPQVVVPSQVVTTTTPSSQWSP